MLAALALAAALAAPPPVEGRPWSEHVPPTLAPGGAALLVVLHCYACTPETMEQSLRLRAEADRRGWVIAWPLGLVDSRGQRYWNATEACCDFDRAAPDDVRYLAGVIEAARARHRIDAGRVFLIGHSNGAYMAHRLACERPDLVAGLVAISGVAPADAARCKAGPPVALLQVHGERDEVVPYPGGPLGGGLPRLGEGPGARESAARQAARDGCAKAPEPGGQVNLDASTWGDETRVERWRGCAGGAVELWTAARVGHNFSFKRGATGLLLDFLAAHPRPAPAR